MKKLRSLKVLAAASLLLFAQAAFAQTNLTHRLVAHWKLDGNGKDTTGNGHNGTVYGSPTTVSGKVGHAIYFDGHNDYINVPNDTALDVGTNGDVSISLWFKVDPKDNGNARIRPLISKSGGSSDKTDFMVFIEDKNDGAGPKLKWGTGNSGDSISWLIRAEPSRNVWHHLVVTLANVKSGGVTKYRKRMYLDCKLIAEGTSNVKCGKINESVRIGTSYCDCDGKYHYFMGAMDDIRFYKREISKDEMNSLCNPVTVVNYHFEGKIKTSSGAALKNSKVYLLTYNAADTSLHAMDSATTDSAGHYFIKAKDTTYYLVAVPDATLYPNEFPTYYDSALTYNDAHAYKVTNAANAVSWSTLSGTNPGGIGIINGRIQICLLCKTSGGKPATGLKVLLMDDMHQVVAFTYTDINGDFQFKDIPVGKYSIEVDKPLVSNAIAPAVDLGQWSGKATNLKFTLYPTHLSLETITSAEEVGNTPSFRLYPNPASGHAVNVSFESGAGHRSLRVLDITGKEMMQQGITIGSTQLEINVAHLPKGVYLLKLNGEKGEVTTKLVKE